MTKYKIISPKWNDKSELPDVFYPVLVIQGYFKDQLFKHV